MSRRSAGFTLVELITVMILLSVLAVMVLPRLDMARDLQGTGFRDQVVGVLRYAQKTAVSHRRLVCASISGSQVTLMIATNFGDTTCATAIRGPDGRNPAAASPSGAITMAASPAGPLYFQPASTITSDGAGTSPQTFQLTITNQSPINVYGETGNVE